MAELLVEPECQDILLLIGMPVMHKNTGYNCMVAVLNIPHGAMALDGVEIFCNASGSHHELRKSAYQLNSLICAAMDKIGGIYVFANQRGCDGDRLYYDGNATIAQNGLVLARSKQFALQEIEVVSATMDLEDVRSYRNKLRSSRQQATFSPAYPRVRADFSLSDRDDVHVPIITPIQPSLPTPEEEIALGPACWMWDYLRRSGQKGYFLPLSGGRDSAAVACLVYSMCRLVSQAVGNGGKRLTL